MQSRNRYGDGLMSVRVPYEVWVFFGAYFAVMTVLLSVALPFSKEAPRWLRDCVMALVGLSAGVFISL